MAQYSFMYFSKKFSLPSDQMFVSSRSKLFLFMPSYINEFK